MADSTNLFIELTEAAQDILVRISSTLGFRKKRRPERTAPRQQGELPESRVGDDEMKAAAARLKGTDSRPDEGR